MKRRIGQAFGIFLLALVLVYTADYVSLRGPIPPGRQQFGAVQVVTEYAVTQKDKKVEFYFDPPKDETCVNSLFPHLGDPPCWWLRRHTRPLIQM